MSDGDFRVNAEQPLPRQVRISVRSLVENTVQRGDINFRFTSRSSAREGVRGHQKVQKKRPVGYVPELAVTRDFRWRDWVLSITGRIDGVFATATPVVVEEIKTVKINLTDLPENQREMHWAQARIYAWIYARDHGLDEIAIQLAYFHLDTDDITEYCETCTTDTLEAFVSELAIIYLQWMEQIRHWQQLRNQSIVDLQFPYPQFRQGQRGFAVTSYRNMVAGRQLLIQGPTGTGKTIGTLFPAIKAIAEGHHDKVFFLTAKTVGRQVAEKALTELSGSGLQIKSVTLTAKDKICFNKGTPCDADHCQYALGYYDKVREVVDRGMKTTDRFTRETIESLAMEHELCPFELSLDLTNRADCVICDYNYVFDPSVYLRRFFDEPEENYCFLIDEAHNLVDRGREMFSAELHKADIMTLKRKLNRQSPSAMSPLVRKLESINRAFLSLRRDSTEHLESRDYRVIRELPDQILMSLHKFCEFAEEWLATHERMSDVYDELLTFYFDALRFLRTADLFGDDYVCLIKVIGKSRMSVRLYCVDPARLLRQGWQRGKSALFFSATLHPANYFQSLLGVDPADSFMALPSPFPVENLGVYVIRDIATSYRQRSSSFDQVVQAIATVAAGCQGNYLIYFPSYRYLEDVYRRYQQRFPDANIMVQTSGMSEQEREDFLDRFADLSGGAQLGFAVMGGIFGEGIDLKGKRLIGVVVVGVGLPQLGIERDLIRDHFMVNATEAGEDPANSNRGFEYAYQFPGMNRVLQTAGRVIRSESDKGIICLIDNRFAEQRYRRLFPPHWSAATIRAEELEPRLRDFWSGQKERSRSVSQP